MDAALSHRYQLERELGRGGMATVWLAHDLRHGRRVALKVLHPELASTLGPDRFLREVEIAASLAHPHILPLHESGEAEGFLFYVMPYVDGESLRDRLRREVQLPVEEAVRIACEVADALGYAHARGLIHRDIKPENILLEAGHAVVADFGVALAVGNAGSDRFTATGLVVGTPAYMSPEQAGGADRLDGRSDIYSLGCVLYEMLAGEPPFSAVTAQALAAKHLSAPPPVVRVTRATVPVRVEGVIERALAKVPADRFQTASEFARGFECTAERRPTPTEDPGVLPSWRSAPLVLGVLAVAAVGLGISQFFAGGAATLNSERVVVFPLRDLSGGSGTLDGEAVATYIGYGLENTQPLRWLDGMDRLNEREQAGLAPVSPQTAARVSRLESARYYIDGSIVRTRDSTAVVLRLHDVQGDSLVKRAGVAQAAGMANLPQLGLQAVAQLLPALVDPGRPIDLSALSERNPAAVADFLIGEREYRRLKFGSALLQYHRALAADSLLAVAALKGAWAALWQHQPSESQDLTHVVLAQGSSLPVRYVVFARALNHYLNGAADSAAQGFRAAIRLDSAWAEAWAGLGETYYHLLPGESPVDSLAEAAFLRAEAIDSVFRPALLHLAYASIRRADLRRAEDLIHRIRRDDPDAAYSTGLLLMTRCVRDGWESIRWRSFARDAGLRLEVPRALSAGGYQVDCAREAYRAAFETDSAGPSTQWGALLGLQALLSAQGRWLELRRLLDSEAALGLGSEVLYLVLAAAGNPVRARAAEVARRLSGAETSRETPVLWALGLWAASERDTARLRSIARALSARMSAAGRRDDVIAKSLGLHLSLLTGDTLTAIAGLEALRPTASPSDLEWQPWESLGAEKILLGELLLSRGAHEQAIQVAAQFDSPQPVIYGVYLPASLSIRIRAAAALGRSDDVRHYRTRLAALRPGT